MKSLRLLIIAGLTLALLAGCSSPSQTTPTTQPPQSSQSSQPSASSSPDAQATDEPVFEITIGLPADIPDSPTTKEAVRLMEEYSGVKLDIFYYGGNDNLPILLASGDLPMAISSPGSHMTRSHILDSMADGLFWDLTDHIPSYENLNSIDDVTYVVFSSGGRIYGIPRERNIGREGVGYRRDWAKQLGIGDAEGNLSTFEELYEFMLAVPAELGKYAIGSNPLNYFGIWFTGVYGWKYEPDTAEMNLACFYPGYMEALNYCRELFEKEAIYPEFAILTQDEQNRMWKEGELAVFTSRTNFASDAFTDANADIGVNGVFPTKNGTYTMGAVGHNGGFFIPTGTVKDEESMLKILNFFNGFANQDMATLLEYGIEGTHYEIANGLVVSNMDTAVRADFNNNILIPFTNALSTLLPTKRAMPTEYTYLQQRNVDVMAENAQYAVFSDITGLISQTYNERGADLNTILSDADIRYVMGAINEAEYQAEIDKWRSMGGDTVLEEFAEAYRKAYNLD